MFFRILLVLLVALAAFAVVAARQPDDFRIARTTTIMAPASVIFPHVNNLHGWAAWSPWDKLDPTAKKTFDGPNEGVGASYYWSGNNDIGEGTGTITESTPNSLVKMRLDFLRPMEATNTAEFTFEEIGAQTRVTWSMYGKNNFIGKAIGLLMNCDTMVGEQFEKGLSELKAISEKTPKIQQQ